ncbi:MAG: hypothetical protein H8E31_02760 [Planctomycetes bacterium]|nr:hypothetical protein [Planctomycetota bacterium]
MPILEIEIVTAAEEALEADLAERLAAAAGAALGAPPGRTWVRLRELPRTRYAEDGAAREEAVRPVFVSLLLADPPAGADRGAALAALTAAIAGACRRPVENVHVLLLPAARGRVAFGGELLQ